MTVALSCTPGAPAQCQQIVIAKAVCIPNLCYDTVAVNDTSALEGVLARWHAQHCDKGCRAMVCNGPVATFGVCVPVDAGSPTGGVCRPPPPRVPPWPTDAQAF